RRPPKPRGPLPPPEPRPPLGLPVAARETEAMCLDPDVETPFELRAEGRERADQRATVDRQTVVHLPVCDLPRLRDQGLRLVPPTGGQVHRGQARQGISHIPSGSGTPRNLERAACPGPPDLSPRYRL